MFACPVKNKPQVESARKLGVKKMLVDDVEELLKLKTWFPKAEIIMRVAIDQVNDSQLFDKFGASDDQVQNIMETCKKQKLSLIGLSFQVNSGGKVLAPYE